MNENDEGRGGKGRGWRWVLGCGWGGGGRGLTSQTKDGGGGETFFSYFSSCHSRVIKPHHADGECRCAANTFLISSTNLSVTHVRQRAK